MSPETLPSDWKSLVEQLYLLRPIRAEGDYNRVVQIAGRLAAKTELNKDQTDYLESLVTLIEAYEKKRMRHTRRDPIGNLNFLVEANGLSRSDLGRILGQRQLGSKILNRTRNLSKTHIRTLAKYFSVEPSLFI